MVNEKIPMEMWKKYGIMILQTDSNERRQQYEAEYPEIQSLSEAL